MSDDEKNHYLKMDAKETNQIADEDRYSHIKEEEEDSKNIN